MIDSLANFTSLFRPRDESFSSEMKATVQLHRLLSLLGGLLILVLGSLYAAYNPRAVDPAWARLGVAGLFFGWFAASYALQSVRRNFVVGLRGLLYVLLGWFAIVATVSGFAGDYNMGFLLLYAILPVVVGVGAHSAGPVHQFLTYGFLLGVGGALVGPAPFAEVLVLTGSLATVALVEGVAIQGWLSTQRRLEERKDQLRSINENISDGIYRSTPNEGVIYANQAFAEMFGHESTDEVYDMDPRKLYVNPEIRERLREEAKKRGHFDPTEVEMQRVDGTTFTALLSATVLRDEDGAVKYYDGAATDITEQKEAQRRLQESEQRYRTLTEHFPNGAVGVYDHDLQYTLAAGAMLGKTLPPSDRLEGSRMPEVFPEPTVGDIEPLFRAAVEEGTTGSVETRFNGRDWKVWATPLRDADGEIFAGLSFAQDVTDQKLREQALEDRQEKVESLYRATNHLLTAERSETVAKRIHGVLRDIFDYPLTSVDLKRAGRLEPAQESRSEDCQTPPVGPVAIDGDSVAARAYRTRETVVVDDLSTLGNEIDYGDLCAGASVPMGEHGAVTVGKVGRDGFNPFDLRLIEILTAHASAVLDRIQRERDLREERDLLNRIFEISPAAITLVDGEGQFVRASERAEDVLGLERDSVTDRSYDDPEWGITAPDGQPLARKELPFAQVMSTESPVYDVEHAIEWPNGDRRLLSVSGAPLRGTHGAVEGAVFHIEDITDRRAAERALEKSEKRFRGVFKNAAIGIAVLDEEGRLLDVNPALGEMTGYDLQELQGRHFTEITHPDDQESDRRLYTELVNGIRDRYQLEKRYVRKGGEVFWGRLTVSRHEWGEEGEVIGMVEDIDDRKRYEEGLREAKEEAERMNRMKSAFLANMSHEIRTPLTSIIGFAEAIGDEISGDERGPIPRFARLIEKSGRRLLETLDGVLNLSKLEAGELEFSFEAIDLATEAQEAAELFTPQAEEAEVALRTDLDASPIWVWADEGGIHMVLRNLISNAVKYTGAEGEVWIRVHSDEDAAVVEVEDTGIGMDPDTVSELFRPFRQESEGVGRQYEGSGIGLAVIKEAVDRMNGSIDVETEKGAGTCFTVRLPRTEDGERPEESERNAS